MPQCPAIGPGPESSEGKGEERSHPVPPQPGSTRLPPRRARPAQPGPPSPRSSRRPRLTARSPPPLVELPALRGAGSAGRQAGRAAAGLSPPRAGCSSASLRKTQLGARRRRSESRRRSRWVAAVPGYGGAGMRARRRRGRTKWAGGLEGWARLWLSLSRSA